MYFIIKKKNYRKKKKTFCLGNKGESSSFIDI